MQTIELAMVQLRAACFCGQIDRENLSVLHVMRDGRTVATNGHLMVVVYPGDPQEPLEEPVSVPASSVLAALHQARLLGAEACDLTVDGDRVELRVGDVYIRTARHSGKFVDWEKSVGDWVPAQEPACMLDPEYLARVLDFARTETQSCQLEISKPSGDKSPSMRLKFVARGDRNVEVWIMGKVPKDEPQRGSRPPRYRGFASDPFEEEDLPW